jgi:Chaperone of endosialidase
MAVPYTFASATGSIPLSQLDTNFATAIVIGNTSVYLGNTITTLNNITLANATISSVVFASGASLANVTLSGTTTVSGNTTVFSGTATRIQGDFSNATLASRTAFQDKTTNSPTGVYALPNGTSTSSGFAAFNNSDPTNAAYIGLDTQVSGQARLVSAATGSGTSLPMTFWVNSEAARITTSGQFLVGVTSSGTIAGSISALGFASRSGSGGSFSGNVYNIYWTGSAAALYIDGSSIGTINVTSDYRIKKNVVTQTANAVARINVLRPVLYEIADVEMYKGDGTVREGFIANELAAVIPSAVDGVKDGLTSDGKIQPQTLRLDPIIAVLTKAVQELSARVATLEAKP